MPTTEPRAGSTRRTPKALLAAAAVLTAVRLGIGILHYPADFNASAATNVSASFGSGPEQDRVAWVPLAEAPARAGASGKPVLYEFSAAWCGPCRMLEHDVFADSLAAASINAAFVPVRVMDRLREDGLNSAAVDSLQRRFGVRVFPTLVVAPADGAEPVVIRGYPGKQGILNRLAPFIGEDR